VHYVAMSDERQQPRFHWHPSWLDSLRRVHRRQACSETHRSRQGGDDHQRQHRLSTMFVTTSPDEASLRRPRLANVIARDPLTESIERAESRDGGGMRGANTRRRSARAGCPGTRASRRCAPNRGRGRCQVWVQFRSAAAPQGRSDGPCGREGCRWRSPGSASQGPAAQFGFIAGLRLERSRAVSAAASTTTRYSPPGTK
jgi:hypothetical protein